MSDNLYVFHLISGERLMGNVLDESGDDFIVDTPIAIVQMPQQKGPSLIAPMPYILGQTSRVGKVDFNRRSVTCKYVPDSDIAEMYRDSILKIKAAESGIELVGADKANMLKRLK